MIKNKQVLSEDTVIAWGSIPVGEYRKYFVQAIGDEILGNAASMDFTHWLQKQVGKTIKEATEEYFQPLGYTKIEEFLTERRFNIISVQDKEFIIAFDEAIKNFGYDFGGAIRGGGGHNIGGLFTITYGKANTKSSRVIARIFIRENNIAFRLYLSKIDKFRTFIENTPPHIKNIITGNQGDCNLCEGGHRKDGFCKFKVSYTIDGRNFEKCNGFVFVFEQPDLNKLPDYISLLSEFYPVKKPLQAG